MKITAVLPTQDMTGALVDTLKKMGFDRNDMIITDMKKSVQDMDFMVDNVVDIKSEREGFGERRPYTDFYLDDVDSGILITVEAPKKELSKIREAMEQCGATNIIQK
ncbi:hypothetical protein BFT35_05885 [Thermoanaerobacterium thermosaccharolyticum]|uniref:Uncharacterized protein n=1 Tax=Thermoanaerobacterium thermosaccharolyticum TaxID=1517 RepID=A0A231VJC6_THETR|nr:hypothetical protein [Thermoanaerobacterium thermosaccharolyticum]AST57790.1 hypothetical protein Thert_01802 [Thermoanaerobacterium thermosaccharolyticum]OXT08264.1 hypothetical protein CE561_05735 [Thermoanaerobacterium thermosaccharolyticum]PHO07446.1 hypothetical protein BFT35_05885 [Thermoanaerobacterium thermosaccharolyticum]